MMSKTEVLARAEYAIDRCRKLAENHLVYRYVVYPIDYLFYYFIKKLAH